MPSRRPLVFVVHDDPATRIAQANSLTAAGYRCLVSGDLSTGLWLAMRSALDAEPAGAAAAGARQGAVPADVILVAPVPLPVTDLPDNMVCLLTPAPATAIVDAVERASGLHVAHGEPHAPVGRFRALAPVLRFARHFSSDPVACS